MILVSLIIIRNGYLDKEITENKKTVNVKVVDCYESGKRNYFLKFEFNGKIFVKRTKKEYCDRIKNAENIELLTNQNSDRFIFADEYESDNDFVDGLLLLGFATVIIFKGYRNLKSDK